MAETPDDVKAPEAGSPLRAQLDELHRLRGAYLEQMATIEAQIGTALRIYFRVPVAQADEFNEWGAYESGGG